MKERVLRNDLYKIQRWFGGWSELITEAQKEKRKMEEVCVSLFSLPVVSGKAEGKWGGGCMCQKMEDIVNGMNLKGLI